MAVVVDDGESGVTEVVRGADLLSSAPRQIYLQRLLGLPAPQYYHIPLVCDAFGRKLGKSQGDSAERLLNEFDANTVLGGLACAAGIIPTFRPASLDELTEKFSWANVRRDAIALPEKFTDIP
ncbi:MAG: glutamate--tRNA ligase family protein [Clostridia bacterium]|nr:glutamate--tRNA ligase family protein [Clostridia bacterium]